jgi:Predicted membrane protein (DUF2207)
MEPHKAAEGAANLMVAWRPGPTLQVMRKLLTVLAVVVVGVLVAAGPAAAQSGESITSYDTNMDVTADGSLHVTETIGYDFGGNTRHGIVRQIPVRFRYDDTHDRVYPVSAVSVTMDDASIPFGSSTVDGNLNLKIGDPNKTISGSHRYVISYTIAGALNGFPDHQELFWNAVGTEWTVPIAQATATVTGPAEVTRGGCFAGPPGSRLACDSDTAQGNRASFGQTNLKAGEGLTVVVAFPPGTVSAVGPVLAERHDLITAFRINAWTIIVAVVVLLIGVGLVLLLVWRVGRDRRYVGQLPGLAPGPGESEVQQRKPLFGAPPVSVEFVPPDRIRPGQVGTLIDEQANVIDVTATIVDFAVRRHLLIRELPLAGKYGGGRDWELVKLTDSDPSFLEYEKTLFWALFQGRDQVRLSELRNTFASDLATVQKRLYEDMISEGWYARSPEKTRRFARGIAIGVLLAAGLVTFLLGFAGWSLIGLGLVVAAVVLLVSTRWFPARTGKGSAMLARIQGFRLYIATAEVEQIKFQEREQIFSAYLPYAMVFGLADRWAGIFADLASTRTDGSAGLYWYAGAIGWNMGYFGESIGGFTTTTVGTIATTPPSASGASGFSGGGFAGGGGGGGGGGSW